MIAARNLKVGDRVFLRTSEGVREKAVGAVLYLVTEIRGTTVFVRREDGSASVVKGLRAIAPRSMVVPA